MDYLIKQSLVEYFKCNKEVLSNVTLLEKVLTDEIKKLGYSDVSTTAHHMKPHGVSVIVVFFENQINVKTFPQYSYATLDFTGGQGKFDFSGICEEMKSVLGAASYKVQEVQRGALRQFDNAEPLEYLQETESESLEAKSLPKYVREAWFINAGQNYGIPLRLTSDSLLFTEQSPYRKVEVFKTVEFGVMILEDGIICCTEKDEYPFLEMFVHVPLQVLPTAKKVLVIGGGEGGLIKEILLYPNIESIVAVDIDKAVINAAQLHLPEQAKALKSSKVETVTSEGLKFIKSQPDNTYDIILIDSLANQAKDVPIFCEELWTNCDRILKEKGVLVTNAYSPTSNTEEFSKTIKELYKAYGKERVTPYALENATYGSWSLVFVAKGDVHPLKSLDDSEANKFSDTHSLKYYDGDVHRAAFVLPKKVRALLQ